MPSLFKFLLFTVIYSICYLTSKAVALKVCNAYDFKEAVVQACNYYKRSAPVGQNFPSSGPYNAPKPPFSPDEYPTLRELERNQAIAAPAVNTRDLTYSSPYFADFPHPLVSSSGYQPSHYFRQGGPRFYPLPSNTRVRRSATSNDVAVQQIVRECCFEDCPVYRFLLLCH